MSTTPTLLDRIPLDADVVLDVGCHMGMLGALYRQRNPRARVLGVDNDIAAIRVAATRLSEAACLDIESAPLPFEVPGGYDCIIYGDVLEHLRGSLGASCANTPPSSAPAASW